MTDSEQITAWHALWRRGDEVARERLFETVQIQLRQIASRLLLGVRANHTLEPIALVNELCIRLGESARYVIDPEKRRAGVKES